MEKVAVINLNETLLKLTIYKVSGGKSEIALTQTQQFAIGKEIAREELLSPQIKNSIVEILKVYRKMIESYGVQKILPVVAGYITKARNYRGFLDEIYNNTGLSFAIVNDEEKIKYLFSSIVNTIDCTKGMFIDVGAYSTNVVKFNRRTVLESFTLPYGTYNAGEEDNLDAVVKNIKKQISPKGFTDEGEDDFKIVGVGKAFVSMGKLAKKIERYPLDIDNAYVVSKETLDKTFTFIKGLELDKIKKIKGIDDEYAPQIASGMAIIKAIYEALKIQSVVITTADLEYGVLSSQVLSLSADRFNDVLACSLESYYEFNKNEFSNNVNVYNMAIVLFKQLKVMHKLSRYYVKPLRIASYMYDSGKCINHDNFAKHGFEKIVYSGLKGVGHKELLLAGFICVCQKLDNFSLNDWIKYKDILGDEELDAVRKLGVILGLAVALNASRKPIVQDVMCDILGDSIIMKTVVTGDAGYELVEGMKVAPDYKKVYKKSLQII